MAKMLVNLFRVVIGARLGNSPLTAYSAVCKLYTTGGLILCVKTISSREKIEHSDGMEQRPRVDVGKTTEFVSGGTKNG
jgi:hypothetical protein